MTIILGSDFGGPIEIFTSSNDELGTPANCQQMPLEYAELSVSWLSGPNSEHDFSFYPSNNV